ncbi:MAG: MFS transporter [Fimbriiglobus sp.]
MSEGSARQRVMWLSTIAFTLMFAVWLMLGMLTKPIQNELNITKNQFYNLTIAAILSGALLRFQFGIWTDQYGGRKMFTLLLLLAVIPTYAVSRVTNYYELLGCAVGFGLAGNSFAIGIAWNAAWWPKDRQGMALGVFGAGNVGASVTKLLGPSIILALPLAGLAGGLIPGGWRAIPVIYSGLLVLMAAVIWFAAPNPDRAPGSQRTMLQMIKPALKLKVWEYSLHYVVVFGAYVALANVLIVYTMDNYGGDLAAVGLLVSFVYIFPASLLRPFGGYLSDKLGAKPMMVSVFAVMILSCIPLMFGKSLPEYAYWVSLGFMGVAMGVGKAVVYKLIPQYFPQDVGAVGGMVGLLGALGGILLPLGWTMLPGNAFTTFFGLIILSTVWYAADALLSRIPTKASDSEPLEAMTAEKVAA